MYVSGFRQKIFHTSITIVDDKNTRLKGNVTPTYPTFTFVLLSTHFNFVHRFCSLVHMILKKKWKYLLKSILFFFVMER